MQELLRSRDADLVASQMLVSRLEAPAPRPDASAQQQELDDLHRQLQVRDQPIVGQQSETCVVGSPRYCGWHAAHPR